MSYNTWMSKTIQKAGAKFADTITSEVSKEYIGAITKRVKLIASLRDFPELREKFRLYLNEEYLNAIKDIPEIEQFMTLDDNNTHRLDTIETDEEKTIEIETLDNSTEQLPEGAEWKLNSSGKYILQIKGKDGSKMSYKAEVASKKFGVKIPESQLPEGAQWKLNSSGKYMLIINEDGAKKSYSAEVASKKLGITPPIIKIHNQSQNYQ